MTGEASTQPTGYRILLPSDWVSIPVRGADPHKEVRRVVKETFARFPADVPRDKLTPLRLNLERELQAVVADAREADALELYLPMKTEGEVNLGASFIVSEAQTPHGAGADPDTAAIQIMAAGGDDTDMSSSELDGSLAVRRDRVLAAERSGDQTLGSRCVDYLVSVPGSSERWFMAAFSTVGAGDPRDELANALVEWFDALMSTFRWSWDG